MGEKKKFIRDSVYGDISLNKFEQKVLDMPQFQRLRRIKQLGLINLIYPGANHTRFEHSIGTMNLGSKLANELELSEDEISLLNESERTQYEKQLKIYRERVALVEQLEQIENANIQYTKPKLKRIKPVPKLEIPKYHSIGTVKIKLPKSEINRNLFVQQLENRSASAVEIRKRMFENSAVCVRIKPMTKVTIPSLKPYHNMSQRIVSLPQPSVTIPSVSFNEKTKHSIHGISNCTKTIAVPQCKFTEITPRKITGIPKKNVPLITPIDFKYERKFTNVPHITISLPKPVKFSFTGSVKIKDMPSLSKAEVLNMDFHAPKCETKDIPKIHVTVPEVSFKESKYKIQGIPKMHIPSVNDDFSAIHRQIDAVLLRKVQPFEKKIMSVPSIKSYMKPQCTVSLSPLKPVSIPSLDKFTPPSIKNTYAGLF